MNNLFPIDTIQIPLISILVNRCEKVKNDKYSNLFGSR